MKLFSFDIEGLYQGANRMKHTKWWKNVKTNIFIVYFILFICKGYYHSIPI